MSSTYFQSWSPHAKDKLKFLLILIVFLLIGAVWLTNEINSPNLLLEVEPLSLVPFFESKWLYTWLLVLTGSFPLIFGFLPKLNFYKVWPIVFLANLPVTVFFILWDIYFSQIGVWGFSETYTTAFHIQGIPWEECLFFLIIPSACIFIYWSLNAVIKKEPFASMENKITIFLIVLLLVLGAWKWENIYTSTTTLLTAFFLIFHLLFVRPGYRGRFYLAYLVSCIPFLVVNGILTGGFTESPVVMYNPEEYFGIRVGTIPVDDFVYSFLMLFANITLFEALQKKQ